MVKEKKEILDNRGSEWHKWDLHIHSPKSWLNNNYDGCTDEDFVKAVKDNGLVAVGLTNYFRFADREVDGEGSIKERLEEEGIVVFPNLEIRLSFQNQKNELCDYHILFEPNTPLVKMNNFLAQLSVHCGDGETCKSNELVEEQLRSNKLYVDFADLEKIVADKTLGIREHVLMGFLSRGKGESRSSSVSDHICNNSDFILHSSASESRIQEDYEFWTQNKSKPIKPIFQGSDAHSLQDIGGKFTWVKALPTLDGLRQVIANPAERLKFQEGSPNQLKGGSMMIDRIETENGPILLSQDLTSIIGMRGNGKSILLKAIASKIDQDGFCTKLGDRSQSDIEWRDKTFGNSLNVVWADSTENGGAEEKPKHVFYLPQGYLSNIAYEENAKEDERRSFLLDLLRKNEGFCHAEKQVCSFIDQNDQDIHEAVNVLFEDSRIIEQATKENKTLGNIEQLESETKNLDKKIKALSSKNAISENDRNRYSESKATVSALSSKILIIRQDDKILGTLKERQAAILSNTELASLSDSTRQKIEKEAKEKGKQVLSEIVSTAQQGLRRTLEKAQTELAKHQKIIDELEPKFKEQKEITSLIAYKSDLDSNIKKMQINNQLIKEKKESIEQGISKICEKYFLYSHKQAEIFGTVQFHELDFLSIELNIEETPKDHFVETYINLKSQGGAQGLTKRFIEDGKINDNKTLKSVIEDIMSGALVIKKSFVDDKKHVINELLRNPFQIDFLRSIKTKDGKTNFLDMTGGQKAIAMLELIFTFDTNRYPILLDQPEDDIDTSGVSGSIVDFIKKQKEKRQIIIVSHSGSLVVCSDSEEIIVAKNDRGKFKYQTGAIENKEIREEIVNILEGGKEALDLRMKKLQHMVQY